MTKGTMMLNDITISDVDISFDLQDPLDQKQMELLANRVVPMLRRVLDEVSDELASDMDGHYSWPAWYNSVVGTAFMVRTLATFLMESACKTEDGWTVDPRTCLTSENLREWFATNGL
jgi:hypothetical protein